MLSSPWVEKIKTNKIWLCESIGKLKGIGKQGEAKMNEVNIHNISGLKIYVQLYGLPKLSICGLGKVYGPYAGRPVGNSSEFMPLDNSLNRKILQSLRFHCILSRFVLDGERTDKEERNMRFSFSTPK